MPGDALAFPRGVCCRRDHTRAVCVGNLHTAPIEYIAAMGSVVVPFVAHAGRKRTVQHALKGAVAHQSAYSLPFPTGGKRIWQGFVRSDSGRRQQQRSTRKLSI